MKNLEIKLTYDMAELNISVGHLKMAAGHKNIQL